MGSNVPKEFYEAADQFISLANELSAKHGISRVSAVIMFAAARFNAHCVLALEPDARQNQDAAIYYMASQYRAMLKDNIAELLPAGTKSGPPTT
jgi:hypothetical protein